MNPVGKVWTIAVSIGTVEAMKDQAGFCRWNYPLRILHQHAENRAIQFLYWTQRLLFNTCSPTSRSSWLSSSDEFLDTTARGEKVRRSQDSMRRVLELSCWGPNTVRF
ncbi:hypothetical protein CDL15_Pgr007240 [Punica granatum]|uniref:Uncharacterized protein n=1 Tax=Punica granatum TaxID=22663 RepID=A0A218X924_PUNGR|nr:hypothetical protein CDL15_Pgr007240 [Punica granatum]PKI51148.1 hypothetical protein CRG98_028435 [Punica granatum]